MDKFLQYLILIIFPFYPLWAWLSDTITKLYINKIVIIIFLPFALYYLITQKFRFPWYLLFLIIFTLYHLVSVYVNHLLPLNTNWLYYIISDTNVLACVVLYIIENTQFDGKFIQKLNRCIFSIVIFALIVSIIQIKFPYFFVSPQLKGKDYIHYIEQGRNFSLFSWVDLNTLGISFPIMISILLSISRMEKLTFPLTIIAGIIVSFLSKARYVMLSTIIVFSQMFFVSKIDFRKKIYIVLILMISIVAVVGVAKAYEYDFQKVIENRILEKGTDLASARARITSYEVFLIKFPEHPLFGVGPSTRLDVVQLLRGSAPLIHVGYLSYLYFYGIIGSLFIFLSIFFLLKKAWTIGKEHLFWGGFYGLLSFCFANATFVYFNLSELGIVLLVVYLKHFSDISPIDKPVDIKLQEISSGENQVSII